MNDRNAPGSLLNLPRGRIPLPIPAALSAAFSLRSNSPDESDHAAQKDDYIPAVVPRNKSKKDAELGTDVAYERIMTSAALRSPSGTYSSPDPYHASTSCFLFYSFFFGKNYPGRVAKQIGTERMNEQIYSFKDKSVMEITGRLVADATVRAVNAEKNVTGFRVAVNRNYKSQGEQKQETSYIDWHLLAG